MEIQCKYWKKCLKNSLKLPFIIISEFKTINLLFLIFKTMILKKNFKKHID